MNQTTEQQERISLDRMDETERRAAMRREFADRIIRIGEDGEEL